MTFLAPLIQRLVYLVELIGGNSPRPERIVAFAAVECVVRPTDGVGGVYHLVARDSADVGTIRKIEGVDVPA